MSPPIRAVALDVDGVLTDGAVYWSADGGETKRFSFRDIMGVSLGTKAGLIFCLISGEETPLVSRYAAKMGITSVYMNCKDKGWALNDFAREHSLNVSEICYMGDDVNDLSAMKLAGLPAAPSDAHPHVIPYATFVSKNKGGSGAVRELVDHLLQSRSETT